MRGCCAVISAPAMPICLCPVSTRSRSISIVNINVNVKLKNKAVFLLNQRRFKKLCSASLRVSPPKPNTQHFVGEAEAEVKEDDFVVVNFYSFVFIKDPEAEVASHLSFLKVSSNFLFL
jgi:hypothetical protein